MQYSIFKIDSCIPCALVEQLITFIKFILFINIIYINKYYIKFIFIIYLYTMDGVENQTYPAEKLDRIRPSRRGVFKNPVSMHTFYAFIRSICTTTTTQIITPIGTATAAATADAAPATAAATADTADAAAATAAATAAELPHNSTFFTLDIIAFKRGIFMGAIDPFMKTLANEYYHERCRFYANRCMSTPSAYAQFVQVIRHICKDNGIVMISSLKYEQSQSNRVYHIEQMRECEIE